MARSAPPNSIVQHLIGHFSERELAEWRLDGPPRIRQMPWSTLYFVQLRGGDHSHYFVVKIVHFPNQKAADVSWTSEELLIRGRREYESLVRVYEHFRAGPDSDLHTVHPRAYLPEINAIVMDYAAGTALYQHSATPRRLITPAQVRDARDRMRQTGRWLRWLHSLPTTDAPAERRCGPADAFRDLLGDAQRLRQRGIELGQLAEWDRALSLLENVDAGPQVWTHGDFHLRNVLVTPDDGILGFDTALERIDHPGWDIGKFTADLKTRRGRILSLGMLPPNRLVQRLRSAFLEGYGGPIDPRALALYEGRFILQKWEESLDALAPLGPGAAAAQRLIIDPTFWRIMREWICQIIDG